LILPLFAKPAYLLQENPVIDLPQCVQTRLIQQAASGRLKQMGNELRLSL